MAKALPSQLSRDQRRALRRLKWRAFKAGLLFRPNPVTADEIRKALGHG